MAGIASRRLRLLSGVPLAIAIAAALAVSSTNTPPSAVEVKTVPANATLLDTESWIMGPSGLPIPPPDLVTGVSERFINPVTPFFDGQPTFPVDKANPLFTPEGIYPITAFTGVKGLEFDPSVAQGVSILNSTITNQIAEGNNAVVLGYSQSATISSVEMQDLLALPAADRPTAEQLFFVLLGDPSNPDGGLLSRFDVPGVPLTIPSLGITFGPSTPADTPWDTAVYTLEYDGFGDFPRYPINLLADLNAFLGIQFVHGTYPILTDTQMASAILLPGSADLPDGTEAARTTNYYMIPTQTLPLLQPLESIPVIGKPLYDLLEPDMRILVDLGYGSITDGWDRGPANVLTPFGVFPTSLNWGDTLTALANGAKEGFDNFTGDLAHLSFSGLAGASGTAEDATMASLSVTDIVNAFSGALSDAYATFLPTADFINALTTTLPVYDAGLFAHELTAGHLLDAAGLPIAANVGLVSLTAFFELAVITNAAASIEAAFQGLF